MPGLRLLAYVFLGAALGCWLLVGLVRRVVLRRGVLDLPNARSSHARPTARGGGIGIVMMTLGMVALDVRWHGISGPLAVTWLVGGGLVALAGLLDDLKGLPAVARAAAHLLAAVLLLHAIDGHAVLLSLHFPTGWPALFWALGVVTIVWSINLFNFMDGIDGLASAQCAFVILAGVLLAGRGLPVDLPLLPAVAMGGAAVGFLIWNLPPARIFMGDVGSGFIGFGLVVAAFVSSGQGMVSLWTWFILHGLFVADSTVTVTVRLLRGQRIFEAHRLHVYQRLARRWSSHGRVTLVYLGIDLVWCLPWAIATVIWPADALLLALAALLPLVAAAIVAGGGRGEPGEVLSRAR
jgi:Fuc2NAc and GlcNAc transferase